jgi:hypothetical protein
MYHAQPGSEHRQTEFARLALTPAPRSFILCPSWSMALRVAKDVGVELDDVDGWRVWSARVGPP